MSSALSTPLPFLPVEVKKEILRFCDQPTLAKTSTLSLAFLQLSSPLLYRHITFEGPEALTKFLTLVAEKRHPELEPWLDLSLVHSITYVDVKGDPFNPYNEEEEEEEEDEGDDPSIDPHRLCLPSSSTPGRLTLHSLKVVLPEGESETQIYSFFDPIEFQLEGVPGGEISCLCVYLSRWTRLRRLVFVDAFFANPLLRPNDRIPGPMNSYGLRISYHFTEPIHDVLAWIKDDLDDRGDKSIAESVSHTEEVVVYGLDEKERKGFLESLADSLLLPRITVVVKSSPEATSPDTSST